MQPRAGLTGQLSARVGMTTEGWRLDSEGQSRHESIYCISGRTCCPYACGVCRVYAVSLRVCGCGLSLEKTVMSLPQCHTVYICECVCVLGLSGLALGVRLRGRGAWGSASLHSGGCRAG